MLGAIEGTVHGRNILEVLYKEPLVEPERRIILLPLTSALVFALICPVGQMPIWGTYSMGA